MNNAECQFDGGDCCFNSKPDWNHFCNDCQCKNPLDFCPGLGNCRLGDGFCDDFLNTEACGFDQGDCCDNTNLGWNHYCHECQCKLIPQ